MNKKLEVRDLVRTWPKEGDDRKEHRVRFEELHQEFLKSAVKEDLEKFYKTIPQEYDLRYPDDDSWRMLYLYLWELIPACRKEDARERQNAVMKAVQEVLTKNMDLCENGFVETGDKYLVLGMIIDILMAGWFKTALGFPAVLYAGMINEQKEAFTVFYGAEAQDYIVAKVISRLSDEECKKLMEKEASSGVLGAFEAALKKEIRKKLEKQKELKRQTELEQQAKLEQQKEAERQERYEEIFPKKQPEQTKIKETHTETPREIPKDTEKETLKEETVEEFPFKPAQTKEEKGIFRKKKSLLMFAGGLFLVGVLLVMAAFLFGEAGTVKEETKALKQQIKELEQELEELKRKNEQLEDTLEEKDTMILGLQNNGIDEPDGDSVSIKAEEKQGDE